MSFYLELKPSSKTIYLHEHRGHGYLTDQDGNPRAYCRPKQNLIGHIVFFPNLAIFYPNMNPNSLFRRLLDSSI